MSDDSRVHGTRPNIIADSERELSEIGGFLPRITPGTRKGILDIVTRKLKIVARSLTVYMQDLDHEENLPKSKLREKKARLTLLIKAVEKMIDRISLETPAQLQARHLSLENQLKEIDTIR